MNIDEKPTNQMSYLRFIVLLLIIICICSQSKANDTYNIRQISNRDGLSNSSVICLFQDSERSLWAGTYDGLNKYNGADIQIYKPNVKNQYSISGNVIRKIVESKDDYLWIMTKGGLNKYSKKKNRAEAHFDEYREDCSMACDSKGNFFILTQPGHFFYYDFTKQKFTEIEIQNLRPTKGWVSLIIDSDDKIWITNGGVIRQYVLNRSNSDYLSLDWMENFAHSHPVTHIYYNKGILTFVDRQGDLYNIIDSKKVFVTNIRSAIEKYGNITSIVLDGNDIIIGFLTSGVIRLDAGDKYAIKKLPINCGVFSLLKDNVQDILWVATDGQGIYACTQHGYVFKGINLEELPLKTQRPVRAIFSDHLGDLWLGTKGNGIIKIKDYENATEYDWRNVEHLSTENGLSNDAVFSFEMSQANNVLWIGSSGSNLSYYSFDDKKIHTLKCNKPIPFVEVHSIIETSDTVLWVSSQFSLFKVNIHKLGSTIESSNVRRYEFDIKDKQLFNKIYSIRVENDSIMWLAMRGNGAIRFNRNNGSYRLITFNKNGIAPMNDILSIYIDKNKDKWFGTSYGVNYLRESIDGRLEQHNYNENDGLSNNTIHGILASNNDKLWFSSNTGLILFDPVKKTFRNFNYKSGLKVIEFSDNAYYKDEKTSKCFFGGIDGVVWIGNEEKKNNDFIPPIYFTKLQILNEEANLDDFLIHKKDKEFLELKYNQNFFTISFSTNDFIDGASIKFVYILENFNNVWMNTNSREAQFTNIPPGEYILRVKYGNQFDQESQVACLYIKILPPWYLSIYAKLFYLLATICLAYFIFLYIKKRYSKKREQMAQQLQQKYKEEMYENKLRFFTNITHEFCTPLTLIHTPSERLLDYEKGDSYVKKYAHIIKSNAERLNNLIQDIIDFRRMETGNKICKIEECDINKICGEIVDAFTDLAVENNINFKLSIEHNIKWNTDRSCIITILNNLVSNAFKYTPVNGIINISVNIEKDELIISVYNTGKGIRGEDVPSIFNRYSVLDNIKENSIKGLSSRNGLGLAICKNMVELLGGEINIESEVDKFADFIVKLPACDLTKTEIIAEKQSKLVPFLSDINPNKDIRMSVIGQPESKDYIVAQNTDGRSKILIVDDNEEILWVLNEILSDEYLIFTAKDGNEGLEQLTNCMPDLVITDIMMPNQDGISMTKQIKVNPHTLHIPVIIVSAKSAIDDKIEGIESGADAYISKPFDTQFLKTVIRQLMEKHKKLLNYYNSSASSFDYMNGQLLAKEDRDFIQNAILKIDQNISDVEFTPEDLADNLSVSLRSLYRRFKDLGLPPPKDFIKKQRIEYSAKLLLSTNLTIQEIMYSAGFTTRSHFYKEFAKRYNQSSTEYRQQGTAKVDDLDQK